MRASRNRLEVAVAGALALILAGLILFSFQSFSPQPPAEADIRTPGTAYALFDRPTLIPEGTLPRPTHPASANILVTVPPVPPISPILVQDGRKLYDQKCASCHGANLEGQPGWRKKLPGGQYPAPPQNDSGRTWHQADAAIYRIIFEGGDGSRNAAQTGMPAFRDQLTGRDAVAIVSYVKSTWSTENRQFQWEMTIQGH